MKCDMHNFWVWVYDKTEYAHRDPVANVVIYSSMCLFGAALGLIFGAPAYVFISEHYPCVGMTTNEAGLDYNVLDSCHFIMAFSLAVYAMFISCIGIIAGELHKPILYSVFGGLGFVAIWLELYSFCSLITMMVLYPNRQAILALENHQVINAMGAIATAGHGLALYSIIMAIRYSWKINFYFTRQEKLVYVEKKRQEKWQKMGKEREGQFGVAELDDDHEFNIGGMTKYLQVMFKEKEKNIRREKKKAQKTIDEKKFDEMMKQQKMGNLF